MPAGRSQKGLYTGSTKSTRSCSSRSTTLAATRLRAWKRLPSASCSRHASGSRTYRGSSASTSSLMLSPFNNGTLSNRLGQALLSLLQHRSDCGDLSIRFEPPHHGPKLGRNNNGTLHCL